MEDRAVVFIDGSNFYHGFIDSAKGPGFHPAYYQDLDFMALARKLVKGQQVTEVRYYVGKVKQEGDPSIYTRQRQLLSTLKQSGVTCLLGRMEKRERSGKNIRSLEKWLAAPPKRAFNLDPDLRRDLKTLCRKNISRRLGAWLDTLRAHRIRLPSDVYRALQQLQQERSGVFWVEKAVDVKITVDMLSMAYRDDYDVAYLLSADGDFTPAVEEVRGTGRKVFVASPLRSSALANHANTFIPLKRDFFTGLWRKTASSQSSKAKQKPRQRP